MIVSRGLWYYLLYTTSDFLIMRDIVEFCFFPANLLNDFMKDENVGNTYVCVQPFLLQFISKAPFASLSRLNTRTLLQLYSEHHRCLLLNLIHLQKIFTKIAVISWFLMLAKYIFIETLYHYCDPPSEGCKPLEKIKWGC